MDITEFDLAVLRNAKEYYGRSWRRDIQSAWMNGNYQGFSFASALQRMRNNVDRKWSIDKVKVPK